MELYKAVFNKDKDKGVYSLSVVETPAMESNFIALSKQENIQLAEVDAKEFTLLGVALIPDKLVYRNQGGREFNLVFPKETIQQKRRSNSDNQQVTGENVKHNICIPLRQCYYYCIIR